MYFCSRESEKLQWVQWGENRLYIYVIWNGKSHKWKCNEHTDISAGLNVVFHFPYNISFHTHTHPNKCWSFYSYHPRLSYPIVLSHFAPMTTICPFRLSICLHFFFVCVCVYVEFSVVFGVFVARFVLDHNFFFFTVCHYSETNQYRIHFVSLLHRSGNGRFVLFVSFSLKPIRIPAFYRYTQSGTTIIACLNR